MKNCTLSFLAGAGLLFAAMPSARPALDFTLQHASVGADGIAIDQVYITDGTSKIFMRIPAAWKVSNSEEALDLIPDAGNSKVRMARFPEAKPFTIDDAGGRDLSALAASQLPSDAKNVVPLPVEINPLPLFGWKTLEATCRYDYFGQIMRRSVMYLSMLPGRVVQLTVIAPDADFDKVHKQARQIMGSWFEPTRDLPPDLLQKREEAAPGS